LLQHAGGGIRIKSCRTIPAAAAALAYSWRDACREPA
jgi:hypothetical protein